MSEFVKVAKVGEIEPNRCKYVEFDFETVALFFVGGKYYAIKDECTHDGGPLAEGIVVGCQVACPRHGALFDLRTGVGTMPASSPTPTYQVKIEGDDIYIESPDDEW